MVCNNTQAAEELVNTSEITTFQHPHDKTRYAARVIGKNENNKYITLIDGTSDARFYITSATWENIIAMENYVGKGNIPQSTSMSLEGELEIMEPLGASFLNRLTDVCDELDTDPVGLVFVLKTIFVGHNEDGTTEMLSNIKPLLFVNYDISAIFDSSGAKYKMMFIGAINGLGKLPHTQKIFNGFNFKIDSGDSLDQTFTKLGTKVNKAYEKYKIQAVSEFAKTLYDAAEKEGKKISTKVAVDKAARFFDANYRSVKYRFFAPDYKDATKYKAADNEHVRTANKTKDGSFNFGKDIGVEEIIKKIMQSSNGVIKDGKGTEDGKKYIYKIVSGLNSRHDGCYVDYFINKYEMATMPYDAVFNGEEYVPPDGQSIEFNYIFTGKNVDIKNFDIKMEMAMTFFQVAATTDSLPAQKNFKDGNTSPMAHVGGQPSVASKGKKRRSKTPLFLGSKVKQPMGRNAKNPVDSASFQALLNRHAALENIEAVMTIYGNPQLLNEMQITPSNLYDSEKNEPKKDMQNEPPKKDKTINPKWLQTPTLVKVNIKMPVDANDINTEYEDFWYTGYYTLFAVKQIFDNGEFLQELDMMSLPVADKIEKKTDDKKEEDKGWWQSLVDYTTEVVEEIETIIDLADGDKNTVKQMNEELLKRIKQEKTE